MHARLAGHFYSSDACGPILRMHNQGQRSSNPDQCGGSEHGALPQNETDWPIPGFHVKIWIGRSTWKSRNSAGTHGGSKEDWCGRSAWCRLQESSSNRRNSAAGCARTRPDRDENYLAQRPAIPKPQCVWPMHLHPWYAGGALSWASSEFRLHSYAIVRCEGGF